MKWKFGNVPSNELKSATVPSGTSGRVWYTCLVSWFSDVLMSSFLSLIGTHSPTVGFPFVARALI